MRKRDEYKEQSKRNRERETRERKRARGKKGRTKRGEKKQVKEQERRIVREEKIPPGTTKEILVHANLGHEGIGSSHQRLEGISPVYTQRLLAS